MYYYARNGQAIGPHSEEELQGLVAQGQVGPDEPVWKQGMPNWAPLRTVIDLDPAAMPPPPPPPPAAAVSPPPSDAGSAPSAYGGPARTAAPAPKSRASYVLLGVFLGGFGIHNFYAGYTGRAIAQLLITLFTFWLIVPLLAVGIWVLVEVITVTRDSQGVPFV